MQIGILGHTKLAIALGKLFSSRGLEVIYGVGGDFSPKDVHWKILQMDEGRIKTVQETIEASDVVMICCKNNSLSEISANLILCNLEDKIIIDCTNGSYELDFHSNTQLLQKRTGGKKIFKAFNNLGMEYPNNDPMGLIKETYFCGPDIPEKQTVKKLISLIGFRPIDAGGLENAHLLEAMFHLRNEISSRQKERTDYHFKLISV